MVKINELKELENHFKQNLTVLNEGYDKFLDLLFPDWCNFTEQIIKDNKCYFDNNQLKFSLRLRDNSKYYTHIDIYLHNDIRPYRRIFLTKNKVFKYRYYEYNSWKRNYDVIVGNDFVVQYTVEYFNGKQRYIDNYYQPGKLFYSEVDFLKHMSRQIITERNVIN
ncbi:hypothetical protein KGP39_03125 [Weissella hellenica]|nr:hypothetical protein [Weissella hellenica]